MRVFAILGCCGFALFWVQANRAEAEEWSRFRGPNASGTAADGRSLPSELGPEKNVVWKTKLPPGHSSPVLSENRIFLTAVEDEKLFTIGLDRTNGTVLWKREAKHNGLEEIHSIGSHAQPTPATDGNIVVSFFGSCGLFCYDIDGKPLWERPMGPFKNNYGAASSPIIVGDLVITSQDHDIDSYLLALNKYDGRQVWRTDRSEFARGFSSPIVWNNNGMKQIVVVGSLRVAGYNARDGKEVWTVRGLARIANVTPVVGDGTLYVTEWAPGGDDTGRIYAEPFAVMQQQHDKNKNGTIERNELPPGPLRSRFNQIDRDKGGRITKAEYDWMHKIFNSAHNVVVAIKQGGTGDVTDTHVLWKQKKFLPYVPSPVYYNGHLFMVKNGGIVSCIDAKTGLRTKQGRVPNTRSYYSSPVAGDGKLYLLDQLGELTVLSAEPKWKVLSTSDFGEETYATPAIAGGRIYLRTKGHLYCFAGGSETK